MVSADTSDGMAGAAERLSVKRTLGSAYRILAEHAMPFAVIIVALAIVNDGCSYLARRLIDEQTSEELAGLIAGGGALVGMILTEILSVIVGVVWFRVILLGETHRARAYLRFGAREFRYLGVDILFGIVIGGPFLIAGVVGVYTTTGSAGDMAWLDSYVIPLTAGTIVWSALCTAWLGLAFPAVATDAPGGSLRVSLRLSRGQRLPLFVAFLLGEGVWSAALLAILYFMPDETGDLQPMTFLATVLSFWARICLVAVSAAAYGQLQRRSDASMAAAFD
jgi:hypothetical protein